MARQLARAIDELESGPIAFYFGKRLLMQLGNRWIVVGRRRFTRRFWALVVDPAEIDDERIASGTYRLFRHDGHTHLAWELDRGIDTLNIPRRGSLIVTVMNPDPTPWEGEPHPFQEDLFEVDRRAPTPFPPALQQRFDGRRYAQLETVDFLDYPGAELVFISQ
jgi:hypothetical protein